MTPPVRQLWARARGGIPTPKVLRHELVAGLPGAISSVPDGMAAAVLVGVSPVHGLYASVGGPIAGGAFSGTRRMLVTTTGAAALASGSALASVPADQRSDALGLMTLFAGIAMLVAGFSRLGRYTRFVSHSVMTGFLTGVACNIILGQIPRLAGVPSTGPFALAKAWNVLIHPGDIVWTAVLTGLCTAAIMVLFSRTRLAPVSAVIALAVPTALVSLAGTESVLRVRDAGAIPAGLPVPTLPHLSSFSFSLVTGALAVAAIVLVQGAGVAQAAPNLDGSTGAPDRDFLAQGAGNLASCVIGGQPVGGSVGQTALIVAAGARTRWAGIFSGIWMIVILLLFSGAIGMVATPTLAALLIYAGIRALHPDLVVSICKAGTTSAVALITTFLATLFLPVAAAVGIGVALSLILQLNQDALDLKVVRLEPVDGGAIRERPTPDALPSDAVTVLDVYGSLLYAGSRTLQARLPDPSSSYHSAVVLRLRGRSQLGATFFMVVSDYAGKLAARDGRLFLSGVDPVVAQQFGRVGRHLNEIDVLPATDIIGESSTQAYQRASAWLARTREAEPPTV